MAADHSPPPPLTRLPLSRKEVCRIFALERESGVLTFERGRMGGREKVQQREEGKG